MKKKMQMFVRGMSAGVRSRTLDVDPDDTVYSVMAQIEDATGVPPILQRIDYSGKQFYDDTPGTLAENKLVNLSNPGYPIGVTVTESGRGWRRLQSKTLKNLGFNTDADRDFDDPPLLFPAYPDQKKMFITVMDHIRMDGGERRMRIFVAAEDTVASLMERVQRRRRYPVAMQEWLVSDAGCPFVERRMDKLDATLADYNVKKDSTIKLCLNKEFAHQAHRERRKAKKAKEVEIAAAHGEQQKLVDDEK